MSLESLLTDTIDIYRSGQGAGITTTYSLFNSGVAALIQPVTSEFSSKTDMNFGRQYNCLLSFGTDISLSDRIIDQNGKTYQVSGTMNRGYGVNTQHLTVVLTEEATEGPDN